MVIFKQKVHLLIEKRKIPLAWSFEYDQSYFPSPLQPSSVPFPSLLCQPANVHTFHAQSVIGVKHISKRIKRRFNSESTKCAKEKRINYRNIPNGKLKGGIQQSLSRFFQRNWIILFKNRPLLQIWDLKLGEPNVKINNTNVTKHIDILLKPQGKGKCKESWVHQVLFLEIII